MSEQIEPLDVTIDKLTLLADLKASHDTFYKVITECGFELQDYKSKKYGYTYVYVHKEDAGYIEIAAEKIPYTATDLIRRKNRIFGALMTIKDGGPNHTGLSVRELNDKLEEIQDLLSKVDERGHISRLKDIRYELNPKYFVYTEGARQTFDKVLSMLEKKTISISSIHIAIDYYVEIDSLKISDTKSRKEVHYKGENKKTETIYVASRSSRSHLCIYDKKNENRENDSIDQYPTCDYVTRFEARLKNNYARDFITSDFNPFKGLKVSLNPLKDLMNNKDLTLNDKGVLFLLMQEPSVLHTMSPSTKKRYVRKLNELVTVSLDVEEDYRNKKDSLIDGLASLVNVSE
ncbi:replication initiation factor domain-containing protein [Bacillus cereus group sp. TH150LC]|uniref:replication initiation factor domain-containing protein n=1 Tax=Bacillus cereus group sp. TH150LC TaxID=3018061 RepID=UPI0022E96FF5|nr:replication initiation factor domain-containing protein [Bacillus cereus group sp. TH150LC]MDA1658341.1 replication initiation factor domain-containing protein [Bacillus cereus group sp. TH150LC]